MHLETASRQTTIAAITLIAIIALPGAGAAQQAALPEFNGQEVIVLDREFAVQIALKQPKPSAVFNSGFEPRIDPDGCTSCEICIDRCPAIALVMGEGDIPSVDLDRGFGCAACATGCPDDAVHMVAKAGHEAPPKDNGALMQAMIASFSK